jgi:hypothetical protein
MKWNGLGEVGYLAGFGGGGSSGEMDVNCPKARFHPIPTHPGLYADQG